MFVSVVVFYIYCQTVISLSITCQTIPRCTPLLNKVAKFSINPKNSHNTIALLINRFWLRSYPLYTPTRQPSRHFWQREASGFSFNYSNIFHMYRKTDLAIATDETYESPHTIRLLCIHGSTSRRVIALP